MSFHMHVWLLKCVVLMFKYTSVAVPSPKVMGESVIIAVGDLAVLICNVSDTPAGTSIKIQWKKAVNMEAIIGANSTTYQVSSSANIFDTDVYTCEVTVGDERKNPLVIPITVSVNVTLTVASK